MSAEDDAAPAAEGRGRPCPCSRLYASPVWIVLLVMALLLIAIMIMVAMNLNQTSQPVVINVSDPELLHRLLRNHDEAQPRPTSPPA